MEDKEKQLKFSIIYRLKKIEKELLEIKDLLLEVPQIRKTLLQKEKEDILFSFKSKRGNRFEAKIKVKPEEILKKEPKDLKFPSFLEVFRKKIQDKG